MLYRGSRRRRTTPETTPAEMKGFIFINFMFGIHRLPETRMYWSTDLLLHVPAVAGVMSRNRYNKLNMYFHLNNNMDAVGKGQPGLAPLFKVRPLLEMVQRNSHAHHYPGQAISIDQALIKFNRRRRSSNTSKVSLYFTKHQILILFAML